MRHEHRPHLPSRQRPMLSQPNQQIGLPLTSPTHGSQPHPSPSPGQLRQPSAPTKGELLERYKPSPNKMLLTIRIQMASSDCGKTKAKRTPSECPTNSQRTAGPDAVRHAYAPSGRGITKGR